MPTANPPPSYSYTAPSAPSSTRAQPSSSPMPPRSGAQSRNSYSSSRSSYYSYQNDPFASDTNEQTPFFNNRAGGDRPATHKNSKSGDFCTRPWWEWALISIAFIMLAKGGHDIATVKNQRSDLDRERAQMAAERTAHGVFLSHAESVRSAWSDEVHTHEVTRALWDGERKGWAQETREETKARDEQRKQWDLKAERREQEEMAERKRWDEQRKQWDQERTGNDEENRRREREKDEKKREDEERRRAGLYWEDFKPIDNCVRYGTKEYTAKLANLPQGYDPLKGCLETEGIVHGVKMLPDHCENKGVWGGMWGHWIIDFDEPSCRTWWDNYVDKGCTSQGSRIRRIEHRLINLQSWEDWKVMCSSTPADFHGLHFDSPTSCANWGVHGIYGYWDIEDPAC